ncbi:hypothetical protein [Burkholderia vietnamiensis]|jgi:hypothetical protein|uniref:hypothetical protein n=1 Tax=Burkholderia vietnamiensis TaxID=60552 RepID=UPI000B32A265|nr:hypothetical protein [Burkholderia vietnamiensis]
MIHFRADMPKIEGQFCFESICRSQCRPIVTCFATSRKFSIILRNIAAEDARLAISTDCVTIRNKGGNRIETNPGIIAAALPGMADIASAYRARNGVTFHFGTDNAVASISVLNRIARLKWGRKMVR